MNPDFQNHYHKLLQWAEQAHAGGWISAAEINALKQAEQLEIETIFQKHAYHPLIVAFFGGTGVGKSSLLNRLAGQSVAKAGMERPTSREVTLYLHEDFKLDLLPRELPTQETRIATHTQKSRRLLAWLDLPDIDSTERRHEALVNAWLPHVDWIIYVVSPERYYDDLGWRFLQERGHRHAWLFIMNHWDHGNESQLEDLRARLIDEGFTRPVILRTSCAQPYGDDDFPLLEKTINNAIAEYGLSMLQELGIQARIDDWGQRLTEFMDRIANDNRWQTAKKGWRQTVKQQLQSIEARLHVNAQAMHQAAPDKTEGKGAKKHITSSAMNPPAQLARSIWSPRNHARLQDLNTELLNQLQAARLPFAPAASRLETLEQRAEQEMQVILDDALTTALAQPGTHLQRSLHQFAGVSSWLLPLIAASWAVLHVVGTFYAGTQGDKAFLGLNFAIHSGLLIGLAWLIPWVLQRKLKPSLADALKRGASRGITAGITKLRHEFDQTWQETEKERNHHKQALEEMQHTLDRLKSDSLAQLGSFVSQS